MSVQINRSRPWARTQPRGLGVVVTTLCATLLGCGKGDGAGSAAAAAAPAPSPAPQAVETSPAPAPQAIEAVPAARPSKAAKPSAGELPAMPDDVPLYPEAKRTTGTRFGGQTLGIWKTTDTPTAVNAFYVTKLAEAGWTIGKNDSSERGSTIDATKAGRKLMIATTRALPEGAVMNISHRD